MTTLTQQDPTTQYETPPMPDQSQSPPGHESQLTPKADHGEQSYQGSGKLTGRTALITGADSGIGRAVALAFAREGADIVISYLNEDDDARETARLVEEAGRKAVTIPGDIGDESHAQSLVTRAIEEFGHLDILVNNAAFQRTHEDISEISAEELERTFRTNVFALFYLCKAALPKLTSGGAIINTASVQAYQPSPDLLAYAATKGAIVDFTKAFSKMAIKQGVRVNAVAPGPVWTPLIPSTMSPEDVKTFGQLTTIGRPAQPAELAPIYVLLASQEGSYITGMVYGATGGTPID